MGMCGLLGFAVNKSRAIVSGCFTRHLLQGFLMLMGCLVPARPPAVLSKEEVEAEKETMRAIDARPIKKVAEAKQRKRKRLQVRA